MIEPKREEKRSLVEKSRTQKPSSEKKKKSCKDLKYNTWVNSTWSTGQPRKNDNLV